MSNETEPLPNERPGGDWERSVLEKISISQ